MATDESLGRSDFGRLATLHVASIDDSVTALLGRFYAGRVFRFLAASDREFLLCERIGARIESACAVSFEPSTLYGRLLRATLPVLLLRAAFSFLVRPSFRSWLRHFAAEALRGGHMESPAPEMIYLFTNEKLRGSGLGRRLVERVDTDLEARGFEGYFLRTEDDPANRAIGFHEANGFVRIGVEREGGRRFTVMHKKLARVDGQRPASDPGLPHRRTPYGMDERVVGCGPAHDVPA